MPSVSVFDMIKVGIGPSSSHTNGPWKAAQMFTHKLSEHTTYENVQAVVVEFFGSLAKTGHGHGTDVAVLLGLSGYAYETIDTTTIFDKIAHIKTSQTLQLAAQTPIHFVYEQHLLFYKDKTLDFHPNAMIFTATCKDGEKIVQDYYSVGGGFVVTKDSSAPQGESVQLPYPCGSGTEVLAAVRTLQCKTISDLVYENERSWRTTEQIDQQALYIWNEMKQCVYRGVNTEGILPGKLGVVRRAPALNRQLLGTNTYANIDEWITLLTRSVRDFVVVNKWISCFALAVNEENASFGRVITAPTNGASGVIPAVLLYMYSFTYHRSAENVIRFLLTAGQVGILFKKKATISAAMGGCQAEIGVSSAMAAAGLTEVLGGSPDQVLTAAEIAMEHHLGLTCDPVGGLVQIPCIERNCMGAMKAITAANLAMQTNPKNAKVSFDQVVQSMWDTAQNMSTKFKETSEGGLAIAVGLVEC